MRTQTIIRAFAILATCVFCSCHEFTDDLQDLGKRVENLEDSTLRVKNTIETLNLLKMAMENQGIVKNIIEIQNPDGTITTTLEFLNGIDPITFVNTGAPGKTFEELMSTRMGEDGKRYWTYNGDWLLDKNGNKICADPLDGKNGTDVPQSPIIRINDDGFWEILTDGEWVLLTNAQYPDGIKAIGSKGDKGEPGDLDPVFISIDTDSEPGYVILTVWVNGKNGKEPATIRLAANKL